MSSHRPNLRQLAREGERLMEYTWIKQEFMDPNWYSIEHYYTQLNKEEKKAAPYCLVEKAKR